MAVAGGADRAERGHRDGARAICMIEQINGASLAIVSALVEQGNATPEIGRRVSCVSERGSRFRKASSWPATPRRDALSCVRSAGREDKAFRATSNRHARRLSATGGGAESPSPVAAARF
jgi:hypothetical protein